MRTESVSEWGTAGCSGRPAHLCACDEYAELAIPHPCIKRLQALNVLQVGNADLVPRRHLWELGLAARRSHMGSRVFFIVLCAIVDKSAFSYYISSSQIASRDLTEATIKGLLKERMPLTCTHGHGQRFVLKMS